MGTRRSSVVRAVATFAILPLLILRSVSSQDCSSIECPTNYAPVCGSDGQTYGNECIMRVESCTLKKTITVASSGECPEQACSMICTADYKPVCGSDGNTYANECILKSEACNQKKTITVASQGPCTETKCNQICTADYRPVCGSDGNTYANECILKSEACNQKKTIIVASQGPCTETKCNQICTADYKPVCGSDGNTYANECILKSEACNQKKTITVASQGPCTEKKCTKAIDLVFAHDSSGSLTPDMFQQIKDFTNELVDDFEIGLRKTHVGVVVFSFNAKIAIRLDETFDKDVLKSKVQNISYMGYTTATDAALRIVDKDMFSLKGGMRQGVPQVLIVLTDGKCTECKENVSIPASRLKARGVKIFAIAIGKKVDVPELLSFVSEPEADHLLQIDSTNNLKTVIKKLATEGCAAKTGKCPAPPTDVTCTSNVKNSCYGDAMCSGRQKCCFDGCSSKCVHPLLNCQAPVEIAFALDSSSSIKDAAYRRMKDVTKRVIDSFTVSQSGSRFSVLLYSSDAELQFNLVRYDSANGVKTAIDNLPHMKSGTRIDKALRLAKEKIFSLEGYVRQRRPMVLVVVTDGSTNRGSEDLAVASKPLKDYGVRVIAVGVGPEVNRYELIKFASAPTSQNIFTSKNFDDLVPSIFSLTEAMCKGKPGTCQKIKPVANCASKIDECENDFECHGTSKCCSDGCKKVCQGQLDVCRRKVDLTFLIDHSDSVGAKNFETIKQFVSKTLDEFKIGPLDTHVSVICFGTTANIEWTFSDYPGQNTKAAKDALNALRFTGGASGLDLSMDLANEKIYNTAYGMRSNVFKLVVVITDGGFGELSAMRESVKALKNKGVNFVALGVGPMSEVPALQAITKYDAHNSRVFLVKRFEFLKQYAQDIADVACFAPGSIVEPATIVKGKPENQKCGPPKCLKGHKGRRGRHGRPGVQGVKGAMGLAGVSGPQGPKGRRGDYGYAGPRGSRGEKGLSGLPGHPGINGIPGIPGVEGRPGVSGQCGLKGDLGESGSRGIDGLPGSAGSPGDRGPRGPKGEPAEDLSVNVPLNKGQKGSFGDAGFEGSQGSPGPGGFAGRKGTRGDDGDAGSDGLPGEKGDPGKVLNRIKGEKGEPGQSGTPGQQGVPKVAGGNFPFEGPVGYRGPKGDLGQSGVAGESVNVLGEKGLPGPKGETGSKGDKGNRGPEGQKGVLGFPGLAGDSGETGPQGPPGRSGPPGRRGLDGSKGAVGLPGDTGDPAVNAPKGEPGKKGEVGLKGSDGSQGPPGDEGPQGPKGKMGMIKPGNVGDMGDRGKPGPRGDPGMSGVTGMEGPEGVAGPRGDAGAPGPPGANARRIDGVHGMDGSPGRKGGRGPNGDPGPPGIKGDRKVVTTLCREGSCPRGHPGDSGPPGPTGPPGSKGYDGPSGPKGYQDQCPTCPAGESGAVGQYGTPGTPGKEGSPGPPGQPGDEGDVGNAGPRGTEGLPGLSGVDGKQGPTGPTGEKGEPADQPLAVRGDPGSRGDKGQPGRQGQIGPNGPDGVQGFKGQKGTTGVTPSRGERGIPGDRGRHANDGAKGIPGEVGDTTFGDKGAKGIIGARGPDGRQGVRGDDGPKGPTGEGPSLKGIGELKRGFKGFIGDPGEDGDPGESPEGRRGITGLKGAKGEQGKAAVVPGAQGPQGSQGPQGVIGAKGEKGVSPQGLAGPTGEPGVRGPKGIVGPQGPPGPKGRAECGSLQDPSDVAFLLDASASLRDANFRKQKFFVKKIINDVFPVSPDGNRIGIIQYSTNAKVEVHFDDYFVNTSLVRAIDDIPYSNGESSRIDLALKLARDDLFKTSKGARRSVRKILVLITDGYQSQAADKVSPIVVAKDLKDQGINIFVIGHGVEINWNLVKQVASRERYVMSGDNFDQLQSKVNDIQLALSVGCLRQKGQKGEPGLIGENGRQGRNGEPGLKGMAGTSFGGSVGRRGPPGRNGEQGVGIQGNPGSLGLMGFPGARGSRGDRGGIGKVGVKGSKGQVGDPAQGPAPVGPKGYPGPPGPKGKSGEKLCKEVLRTDLAFFLDSSASVGIDNFKKTKSFIETIAKAFDVSPTNTHVSVSTYEQDTKIEFDFLEHTSLGALMQAIQNIPYRRGRATYIDSALISADQRVFTTQNKARPDAFKAVILLTDGQQSTRPAGEVQQDLAILSQKLRAKGIRVYVIGIGAEVDKVQLRSMVDVPHHLFLKKDFDSLSERIELELVELNDLGCSGEKGSKGELGLKGRKGFPGFPGTVGKKGTRGDPGLKGGSGDPGPPSSFTASGMKGNKGDFGVEGLPGLPGCVPTATDDKPLDLAFLMDASGSLYYDNYNKEKEFVKRVISLQNIGRGYTHVSIMSYSQNATVHVGFKDYYDRNSLYAAVNRIPYEAGNTRIDKALLLAKAKSFSSESGARPYAKRVAILLTDGQQTVVPGSMDVARAAKLLKDDDVEVYAVGIGPEIDLMQLGEIVSKPSYVFFAADFDRLIKEISREVTLALRCTGGPPGPRGDIGPQGGAGLSGKKGDRGDQGLPGIVGATGRTGLQGDDGSQGITGPKGAAGLTGDDGDRGDTGFEGFQGFQGASGDDGARGATGDVGPRGNRGLKGYKGVKGQQGEIPANFIPGPGPKGYKGFKGDKGSIGFPGFRGDEDTMPQSMLDSLRRGPQGDVGDSGPRGPPGRNGTYIVPPGPLQRAGEKGNTGPQGQKGESGSVGSTGQRGSKGEVGDAGATGIAGPAGQRGNAGPKGFRGPRGRPGSSNKGAAGGPGSQGRKGQRGEKGRRGEPGFMGLNGLKGDRGIKGPKGFPADPLNGLKGTKGYRGDAGSRGSRGRKGIKGETLQGRKGAIGEEGPVGSKGDRGPVGPQGPKGFAGFWGIKGIKGPVGEDGDPGYEGPKGIKGDMGEIISNGENKGDLGDFGDAGLKGITGDEGPAGPIGEIGTRGKVGVKGERGKDGLPGLPGNRGPDGDRGQQGPLGPQGPRGDSGDDGLAGPPSVSDGFYIVRHSQTDRIPECPNGFKKLWDGYSWVYSVGNGMAHGQDLANAGSCVNSFSTMPFLHCESLSYGQTGQRCTYSSRNDYMYWLSARNTMLMNPVSVSAVSPFISRCAVCETPAVHMAVHSQDTSQPDCPLGWSSLWSGYSFLMMTGSGGTGTGESLTSSGSCLEDFRTNPFIECQGARGTCNFFSDKFSFWLTTVDAQTQFQAQASETLHGDKGHNLKSKISRCRVCTKGFINNQLGGPLSRNSTSSVAS